MLVQNEAKAGMESALEHLKQEFKSLRTSRANPAILDSVQVEVYGTKMRLKELANVTSPEVRQLLVTPYDPSNVQVVAKAIDSANLGFRAALDKNVIRIQIPPMDESIRKLVVKDCKKKAEEAKVAIREERRKSNEKVRRQKQEGLIPEDMVKKEEKKIQELTDEYCKKIDVLCGEKEKEILSV